VYVSGRQFCDSPSPYRHTPITDVSKQYIVALQAAPLQAGHITDRPNYRQAPSQILAIQEQIKQGIAFY